MNKDILKKELTRDESKRYKAYDDATGNTIYPNTTVKGTVTIGVGRNLIDVGLDDEEIDFLLEKDIARQEKELDQYLPWWRMLDDVRARALMNMAFNLGVASNNGHLLTFKDTLRLMQDGKWDEVASHLRGSLWHTQVGIRADRIIHQFETGQDP